MKNKLTKIALVLTVLVYGCNKMENLNNFKAKNLTSEEQALYEMFETAGVHHNNSLDYSYDFLMALDEEDLPNSESEMDELILQSVTEYYSAQFPNQQEFLILHPSNVELNLSSEGQLLKNQIFEFIDIYEEGNISINTYIDEMDSLEREATRLPTNEEKLILGTTAGIAKYSGIYWSEEGDKYWNFYTVLEKASPGQIAALKADAAGGFWGAVGGAALGAPVMMITGSYGAAYGSTKEAFKQKGYDCWFCP